MALDRRIGGFDPGLGVLPLRDGVDEIGRANLPKSARVIPESDPVAFAGTLIYGEQTDSALAERFAAYLAPDVRHRELLSPDVFFAVLEEVRKTFAEAGEEAGDDRPGEGPLAEAARAVAAVLADKGLCDMLRNLVKRA